MTWYGDYPKYVSVAERKAKAAKEMAILEKKGIKISPVIINGKKITTTFWGNAWCDHIETYRDYESRLPRGRTYVRNGSVVDLQIEKGKITAKVQGSSLYKVEICIDNLNKKTWGKIKKTCTGKIGSLIELIQGKLSDEIIKTLCDQKEGLFPSAKEIKMKCNCPDYSNMCKHLAATFYGVGARLDQEPELFFLLRGVDKSELFKADLTNELTKSKTKTKKLSANDMGDVFGISLDNLEEPTQTIKPAKVTKKAVTKKETTKKTKPKKKIIAKKAKSPKTKKNRRAPTNAG